MAITREINIGDTAMLPAIKADKKLALKWAKYLSGNRNFTIAVIGSSTPRGRGAGYETGTTGTAQWPNAWPAKLATALRQRGFEARSDSIFGHGVNEYALGQITAFDNRVVLTGDWGSRNTNSLGGVKFRATAAGNVRINHEREFDRLRIYWEKYTTAGSATVSVDGGASLGTIDRNVGSMGISSTDFSVSLGTHYSQVFWASGIFSVLGVRPFCSAKREIEILNFGSNSSSMSTAWFDPAATGSDYEVTEPKALPYLSDIDLLIINRGRNEWAASANIPTFISRLTYEAEIVEGNGGSVLMVLPFADASYLTNNGAAYVAAMRALALQKGWPIVDYNSRAGTYAGNAGFVAGDDIHLNDYGHQDLAQAVLSAVWG